MGHTGHYAVNPRSATRNHPEGTPFLCGSGWQGRGVDSSVTGAAGGKGDERRGPFATEPNREDQTMDAGTITRGIAIIGMTTAAQQMLDAASLMRTDESAALDKLADAIACAGEAYRCASGNRAPMPRYVVTEEGDVLDTTTGERALFGNTSAASLSVSQLGAGTDRSNWVWTL